MSNSFLHLLHKTNKDKFSPIKNEYKNCGLLALPFKRRSWTPLQDKQGEIEHLSLLIEHKQKQEKDRIDWRRNKVQELSNQGHSQREIAQILQVSNGTVNRDLSYLRQQAKSNIRRYIDERLPEEYEKCMVGLTAILREAWNTSQQAEDRREKIEARLAY